MRVAVVRRSFRGFSESAGKYEFEVDEDVVREFVEEVAPRLPGGVGAAVVDASTFADYFLTIS